MTLRGDRITHLRKELGIKQLTLAEMLDVTPNLISKYENGYTSPPLDKLAQIAEALNTTTDYLLGRSNIPHPGAEPDPLPDLTPTEIEVLNLLRTYPAEDQKWLLEALTSLRRIGGGHTDADSS